MKIKEWFEKYAMGLIIISIVCIAFTVGVTTWHFDSLDDEEVIIEGKIISVEYLGESNYYLDGETFNITFDNGESYIIESGIERDFTVNSEMIVKLWRDDADSNWEIKKMYKVPSED